MTGKGEVLFEFRRIGSAVKVSAVDAETGVEVAIMGAANTPEIALKRVALAKLRYVMAKNGQ